jgi:hypothetical protein
MENKLYVQKYMLDVSNGGGGGEIFLFLLKGESC